MAYIIMYCTSRFYRFILIQIFKNFKYSHSLDSQIIVNFAIVII